MLHKSQAGKPMIKALPGVAQWLPPHEAGRCGGGAGTAGHGVLRLGAGIR